MSILPYSCERFTDSNRVRPLGTYDVRARTLSGRHQITSDGRHLLDGIAFGGPLLRRPSRPAVHIPPRKHVTTLTEGPSDDALDHAESGDEPLLLGSPPEDLAVVQEPPRKRRRTATTNTLPTGSALYRKQEGGSSNSKRSVSFHGLSHATADGPGHALVLARDDEDEDDDSEDSNFDSDQISQGSEDSSDSADESSSTVSSDSASEVNTSSSERPNDPSSSDSSSSDSDSESDSDSDSDDGSSEVSNRDEVKEQKQRSQRPPGQGLAATKRRNMRRQRKKRLTYLKNQGILPSDAGKDELQAYDMQQRVNQAHERDDEESSPSVQGTREHDHTDAGQMRPQSDDFNEQRDALLEAINEGGIDVAEYGSDGTPDASKMPKNKPRLDVAGSQRMLLGSLGVRTPKTAEEREELQQRLASQGQRKPITKVVEVPTTQGVSEVTADPGFWKAHIKLTASECIEEDADLGTPPYPYYHRWWQGENVSKKRKRKQHNSGQDPGPDPGHKKQRKIYYEDVASDVSPEETDYLDYGEDTVHTNNLTSQLHHNVDRDQSGAAGQYQRETLSASANGVSPYDSDDLPPIPPDLATLPSATLSSIIPGTVIVFSNLEVSAATNWQPALSPLRTASVEEIDKDGFLGLKLANRDLPRHEYDDQGKRIYRKFEMEDADEEDDALLSIGFAELVDPRVLLQVPKAANAGDGLNVDDTLDGLEGVIAEQRGDS